MTDKIDRAAAIAAVREHQSAITGAIGNGASLLDAIRALPSARVGGGEVEFLTALTELQQDCVRSGQYPSATDPKYRQRVLELRVSMSCEGIMTDKIDRAAAIAALEKLYEQPISCEEIGMAVEVIRAIPAAIAEGGKR